ncbi:Uncharacterized protein DBV15_04808 [Temnothorax longispinosus]|uniref:Uncharacterized protein n=1 Tax=Temnothorax longispinosus TaxID=300112 RepID=A0A4S2JPJ2_9HYME|nr:Uncharacterized protein DBV15_04808 [Temnothorax longispinosus]
MTETFDAGLFGELQFAVFPTMPTVCREGVVLTIKAETLKGKLKCSYSTGNARFNENCTTLYHLPKEKNEIYFGYFAFSNLRIDSFIKECKDSEILYYKTDNPTLRVLIEQIIARDSGLQEKVQMISNL